MIVWTNQLVRQKNSGASCNLAQSNVLVSSYFITVELIISTYRPMAETNYQARVILELDKVKMKMETKELGGGPTE